MTSKIIKFVLGSSAAMLIGGAVIAIRKQMTVTQAHKIREQQRRYGSQTLQLSQSKRLILQQADSYIDTHAGRKMGSMMRTQQFYAFKIQKKLRQKNELLQLLMDGDKDQIQKIKDQIDVLNRVYKGVTQKKITSWEELREKDQEEEGY